MIRSPRKIHKYLSLAISVQLLLWTISGIYFSFNKIEPQKALLIVADKTFLKPISVVEITKDKSGSEYRGRSLPLYKIETINKESEEINVYLDPFSEEIVAIRSNQWRIWDFMWGIHIMDWNERDNIGNIFLKVFSILALLSALSGIYLFFVTNKRQ